MNKEFIIREKRRAVNYQESIDQVKSLLYKLFTEADQCEVIFAFMNGIKDINYLGTMKNSYVQFEVPAICRNGVFQYLRNEGFCVAYDKTKTSVIRVSLFDDTPMQFEKVF